MGVSFGSSQSFHDIVIGSSTSADTSNTLTVYNTGDAIYLYSGNPADDYNAGNIVWRSQGGQTLGRIFFGGTSLTDLKAKWTVYDETGASNDMIVINASGGNTITLNGDILPDGDDTRNIGSTGLRYSQIFLGSAATDGIYWSNNDNLTYNDSTNVFTLVADGSSASSKLLVGGTTYPSDARLKQNFVKPAYNATDEISKMDVREYQLKVPEGADPTNPIYSTTKLSVIIGEFTDSEGLQEGYIPDIIREEIGGGYYGINLSELVNLLVKSNQELNERIKALEAK